MDLIQLYSDYSVDYKTEGHKHCHPGWVNTPCPHCTGNPGYHLGYNLQNNYYYCYRCGWHPIEPTIAKLLSINYKEVEKILKRYGILVPRVTKSDTQVTKVVEHRMPSGTGPLMKNHKLYLESRGFDSDLLERTWNLVGTGPVSLLDGLNYKLRIIAPVIWDSQAVSFISRDITGKSSYRYITCPKDRELILHKHILYGKQDEWRDTAICVEGITDAWRFGTQAIATFGIQFTTQQVREMRNFFKRIMVVYDDDPQAVVQASKLVSELKFRGVDAKRIDIVGDPGSMKQEDADYLLKQLI